MARPFLSRNSGPACGHILCKEMVPSVEPKPGLMQLWTIPRCPIPGSRDQPVPLHLLQRGSGSCPAQPGRCCGSWDGLVLIFFFKSGPKILAVPDNAPRVPPLPSRSVMMEGGISFFTQRVTELRDRPPEKCLKAFPGEMSKLGQRKL